MDHLITQKSKDGLIGSAHMSNKTHLMRKKRIYKNNADIRGAKLLEKGPPSNIFPFKDILKIWTEALGNEHLL